MIGDAVLRLDIVQHGYLSGKNKGKKLLGDLKIKLIYTIEEISNTLNRYGSNISLAGHARELELERYVIKNPCQHGEVSPTTLASTVEALIGAVWLDSGNDFEQVQWVITYLGITGG